MRLAVACDYCDPWAVAATPGVSVESRTVEEAMRRVRMHDLDRAMETRAARQYRVLPTLLALLEQAGRQDWDGEGAPALSVEAVTDAFTLIGQIPEIYPLPELYVERTGEVGLEWFVHPYQTLLLSVPGDGFVYYNALLGFKNAEHGSKRMAGFPDRRILSLLDQLYRQG